MSAIFWWGVVWTVFGTAVLLVTQGVTRWLCHAAARHVAWFAAFLSLWLFPVYAAVSVLTEKHSAVPCSTGADVGPTGPLALTSLLLIGWAGGTVFTVGRAILGRRLVSRWYSRSRDYLDQPRGTECGELCALLPKRAELRVALQGDLAVPITWGIRKPVVLLPPEAQGWEVSRLRAVLLHESAHIQRFDNLTQIFALLTCVFHWFNPVFWLGARRMEAESEMAADDFAIRRGLKPSNYARELLSLASLPSARSSDGGLTPTALIKAFTLEDRLLSIIDPHASRGPIRLPSLVPAAAILFGAVLALTLLTSRVNASLHPKVGAVPGCLSTTSQ